MLIELDRSEAVMVDRPLYRELAKRAVKRATEQLRVIAAAAKTEKSAARANADAPVDPIAEARREHGRALRELADQAHGANLDLGQELMNGLATVDPADINVARHLGGDHDGSPYTSSGDRVTELAMRGIRLVIDEFRTDVTKPRKDGSLVRLRIEYGDPREPEEAVKWLFKFLDGARSAGSLFCSRDRDCLDRTQQCVGAALRRRAVLHWRGHANTRYERNDRSRGVRLEYP